MERMMRVGVTQRRDLINERNEARDALDVQLAQMLWDIGFVAVPLASEISETASYLDALGLDAYVLSGGGDVGDFFERDRLERAVLSHAARNELPVMGICRGMQLIIDHCGGTLTPVVGHVRTRHIVSGPCVGSREVNSFHNYSISTLDLPQTLESLAHAPDGTVEAVRHRDHPWTAIMWHPERERPHVDGDLSLISAALTRNRHR